ncbi:predicted protein [Naegleria gruberi]|uniref:Predicted protein n=1 Tax=Naegleria gruberi TaxID=5762 RepID=D2V761_NAEGR|nr:uncharacterized protein NAEGRDRAFT_64681 [Naegleria gruberi]EFC47315.1 predicted protein [Naegleria gruberi]|eukprot:XP_002680059.1 predicted protein [Naegleria gruberi strain NEG-M]
MSQQENLEEIILPSSLPFIKSINQPLKKYLNEEETLRSASQILSLINFSECANQTLQQEDVESICALLDIIKNILDVTGKDMVANKLLTSNTISELISTMFKFLIDIHYTTVLEESVLSALLESQEFLLSNFPSTFENFIGDITNVIPQLCQIYLSFFPNNGSKECLTETASIMFLPNICKFTVLHIHSADQCIVIQKYATNILKTLVGRHPIIAQHRNVFNNICNQIRYSSNEIKLLSMEIVTLISSTQSFDPTIHKNLINLIITLLNGYYGMFPSYRTLEFDDLFADLLNSTMDEMILILSYFGIERIEMINTITSYLYWNISNSKSEKFKKQIINILCVFIDKYSMTDLELVLKGIEAIKECFQNHIFPNNEDFIDLIKKYLSIHYSSNATKRKESQTDSQGSKRRKIEEGDFNEDINSSFNSAEFPSHEFGNNFYLIDSEYGQILFETLQKYVSKCSENDADMTEMYILLMALCPFGPVKDSLALIDLIHSLIDYTKNCTEVSSH